MKKLLQINKLHLHFDDEEAVVNDLSLHINEGEIYALVGESGSGKSLTALSILRLVPENARLGGQVIFAGKDLMQLTERAMCRWRGARIGMIFQEPQSAFNPVRTIGSQIMESLSLHQNISRKSARRRCLELLHEVALPDPEMRIDWYVHQLSGGQKQRALIASALAGNPELLIADEPTTALDASIQAQILNLLKHLQRQYSLSILFITHDMGVVAKMADRIGVMRNGELLEETTVRAFFAAPRSTYSKMLISALPKMKQFRTAKESETILTVNAAKIHFPVHRGLFRRTVGHIKAVDGVSLSLHRGETVAIVGESGSGKSTLGRAILNLQPLTAGRVVFMGTSVHECGKHELRALRKQMQVIFQDPFSSMNPRMRVGQIISEGMLALEVVENKTQALEKARRLLVQVGMQERHTERFPHEFSGGQRQRIAIARALAVQPSMIVCDEPTSALDVSIRKQILELLDQLQLQQSIAYIFITHDLPLISQIAHRVVVMKEGQVVESAGTRDIFLNPSSSYTKMLIDTMPTAPT